MSKTVVISLGRGSLTEGFPYVTARLRTEMHPQAQQVIGHLPAAPALVELYRLWQSTYRALSGRLMLRSQLDTQLEELPEGELEIDPVGVTQVSQQSFEEISTRLAQAMNDWLDSEGLRTIEKQLRSQLNSADTFRFIIETDSDLLRRLPWHCWSFFQDYPHAEMALSQLAYKRRDIIRPQQQRTHVRILAIIGNSYGIDVEPERQALRALPDAEVTFLVAPSRQLFDQYLWDKRGWDILFFAGHSQTENQTGRLYINEEPVHNSLTIEQLEEGLKSAVTHGLQLAIFNSCDGVGLAVAIAQLQIPQIIVMREPVPNRVAQTFLQHFLSAFATEKLGLYPAIRRARGQLQGLENEFPGASWLPVLCQNPAAEPLSWFELGGRSECPYQGLSTFQEADAHLFFGREKVTEALLSAVTEKPFVAVTGPSGSGKSSVVFAGLIPRLRQNSANWQIVSIRPGNNPFDSLAEALISSWSTDLAIEPKDIRLKVLELAVSFQQNEQSLCDAIAAHTQGRFLLVIDQFEELYTLCNTADQQLFLNLLMNAVQFAPAFSLLITLRADFFGNALSSRWLSDALQLGGINLGPMNGEELERAIAQPAAKKRVTLEPGLADTLIQSTANNSGYLPLLEFTLTELWQQQQNGCLTHEAYRAIGGIEKALANHAEATYAKLSSGSRQRMQRIFVQLIEPGAGNQTTRRIANRDEVGDDSWPLVSELASARLVTTSRNVITGKESVEIIHEALIPHWGRLDCWIQASRDFRQWQENLRRSREQWEQNEKEAASLLRGKSLAIAQDWYQSRQDDLSTTDIQFIEESVVAQSKLEKQQKRRRMLAFGALWTGLFMTSSLTAVAWWGNRRAQLSEIEAVTASSNALFISNQRFDALVAALRATQKLNSLRWTQQETHREVETVLRQAVSRTQEKNRLLGHEAGTTKVVYSPNGKFIASASQDQTIKLWQPDGALLKTLEGHASEIWGLAISPDGQTLASASNDQTVKLWQVDGTLVKTLTGHSAAVNAIAFSPDGQLIASASQDGFVQIWERSGERVERFEAHEQMKIDTIAFSPNGQQLVTGGDDGAIKLWESNGTLKKSFNGHTDSVRGLAFSPDGETLASAGADGVAQLWQISNGSRKVLGEYRNTMYAIAFSPDGRKIVSASNDNMLRLWQRNGALIHTFRGHKNGATDAAFSPDGQTIVSTSLDSTVRLWQWSNPLLTSIGKHEDRVWDVAFSPDSQLIASASADNTINLWQPDGNLVQTLKGHTEAVYSVAISPDSQFLASASRDNSVRLWRLDGSPITTLSEHTDWVTGVAISPDAQVIASASNDGTLNLWQRNGKLMTTLKGHTAGLNALTFSPDGQLIASTSDDGTIRLWQRDSNNVSALENTVTLKGHTAGVNGIAFSPNGQLIASASDDKTVRLWQRDGTFIKAFEGHENAVIDVAFSPLGQQIASSSDDKTVRLWHLEGGAIATIAGYQRGVNSLSFSPDGTQLATASVDRTVSIWNLEPAMQPDALVEYGCQQIQDYLKNAQALNDSERTLCN